MQGEYRDVSDVSYLLVGDWRQVKDTLYPGYYIIHLGAIDGMGESLVPLEG
jgi:hypothetical protein